MTAADRIQFIKNWIKNYCNSMEKKPDCLVVGVSGGIDSAVVSTISAMTEMRVKALSMPIRQLKFQDDLSRAHLKWLKSKFSNVDEVIINLDEVFNNFEKSLKDFNDEHAFANSRARLRMTTLYQIAGANNGIVVGTGNKVEDFGVGFYTKYGDGGVDISPIADCLKTQVWEMGKELKILESIIKAPPTDGLWADGRTDESQLGMSYEDLEKAMLNRKDKNYEKYLKIRKRNLHKMSQIPICKFNNDE
ncbi:MAG: NAD(+) synthase [Candidatus Fonsibacter ubiquis]|nr:NAD(+) synthase [Candidatus Fonsibacter ubiquis]NCU73283.1 NAD(+) synthase [Candidatus Fonsibacter ubiquis]NDC18271.1 NAD(+) synthase [Pseudomonadota bacterium]NDD06137.1 NAD(+) synthase [Pseudomonadota bacterium]